MNIEVEMKLGVEKGKNCLIVSDLESLSVIMGTKGIQGNLHMYGVTKLKNKFIIPISKFQERLKIMRDKLKITEERLKIMEKVELEYYGRKK